MIFYDTRDQFQLIGKFLEEKVAVMLQEVSAGELNLVERQVIQLGNIFEEKFTELSAHIVEKSYHLHTKENAYMTTEEKLIQMIIEQKELAQNDDSKKPETSEAANKDRSFQYLVHLESQCKITHYELNNVSLELKDAYLQMTETIEELERFKADMLEQMSMLIAKQAQLLIKQMRSWFDDIKSVEQKSLEKFQSLLDQ